MRTTLNFAVFIFTVLAYLFRFRDENGFSREMRIDGLRYFTILSNLFCAFASLALALSLVAGTVPFWIWLWKYIGVAAVTVTLLTVLFFLGPSAGFRYLLAGMDLYLHLVGPLLAIVSFCFFDRLYPLSLPLAATGLLPVVLYGAVYLYKVVLCPEEKCWEDFYGFNRGGKWPVSFAAMVLGGFAVCCALYALYRI